MRIRSVRHLTVFAALALASVAAAAACSSVPGPLPIQPPTTAPSTAAPSPTAAPIVPSGKPAQADAPVPAQTGSGPPCSGAIIYRLDASDTGRAWPRLCIAVGGVLRVEHLGPDGFSANAWDKVDCWYEARVRECRLIHTGTVRFTITSAGQVRPLTLVIADASSPPKPSPACLAAGKTHIIDAAEGGPRWSALCMKLGAVLRVENLGPEGFAVSPSSAVSCRYEAAVRTCLFAKAGTVTFTITHSVESRPLTVVAVK
jgi:hypothetical protein